MRSIQKIPPKLFILIERKVYPVCLIQYINGQSARHNLVMRKLER